MDLSTAASSSGGSVPAAAPSNNGSNSNSSSSSSSSSSNSSINSTTTNGGGDSAVACPVCTLYLREGISLQKHLDTHPKEQVIEALIRASASGGGGGGGGVSALFGQQQQQSQPPPAPTPSPAPTPTPASTATATTQPPAASPSPHVSHAPSPFPIGPIYHECPPLNAMIPPAQFASFSYQQFVNNGTMMIPAQYAMAQAQPPQASQMMQMLYNPYGMYHQQQIPTVQMISAPPPPPPPPPPHPPMMPTSTTVPSSMTTRMRPTAATSTSNVTITPVMSSEPPPPPTTTMTTSLPLPAPPTSRQSSVQSQQQQQQQQQQMLVVEPAKRQQIVPGPDRILPDLEPPSPEPQQQHDEAEETTVGGRSLSVEHHRAQQNGCATSEQQRDVEQYHRADPPTLIGNDTTENDKTERILPDIEDDDEIESLIVRDDVQTQNRESSSAVEVAAEPMDTSVEQQPSTEKATAETIQSDHEESSTEGQVPSKPRETVQAVVRASELLSIPEKEVPTSSSSRPEVEKLNQLLVNMESDFNNVELSSRYDEESVEKEHRDARDVLADDLVERKHVDEDESTSVSYRKINPEQIECKIIVAHDESDVSSVASSGSMECNLEIRKVTTSSYHYKSLHSRSAPTSPVSKKMFHHRSCSRASMLSYPVGFEAAWLRDCLKDNYSDADMELEEPHHHAFLEQNDDMSDKPKDLSTNVDSMKARRSRAPGSPISVHSTSSYGQMEDEEEDSDVDSCLSKDDEEDEDDEQLLMDASSQRTDDDDDKKVVHREDCKAMLGIDMNRPQDQSIDFRSQSIMADNYSAAQFPLNLGPTSQQHQLGSALHHETYPLSNSATSHNLLNISESADPTTSTDSKSCSSSNKSTMQKPSAELLNINEDAHAGPMNVFEFDGLQILVPSTFISESSQKAVSGTSQQSMSSSENGAGNDEEVKSVNMRADETMPPRGELSEQESNGCTEQSAWQLYMGQESSRMSTSYDLMARESWEESEGSDHEENNAGPLLDSRSLATHFTSSLFLDRDRDRKTPTRRVFKCSHCPEIFDCPKERRVHSTMVHKEAGPSTSNDNMDQPDMKEIKVLDSRSNVFDELFVPGLHAQQIYQQPLLHQLQPPQQNAAKVDGESKMDGLHIPTMEVICSLCNQRFTSEKSLQIHHRRMHDADSKRIRETTKCQICNEEFTSVASYNLHLKIHPLECGQCGKYFYRKQNFKLHMKRHLGIKPFQCTMCDKAFLTKQKLDEHTNGHTGNAPVKCNLCNETFRRYSNLTQHKNRHHLNIKKKLKDYICHCGEVFHTKKKLAWHKETHDEKPKACTYCNERFIHMASLTRHMRRAHNRRFVPDAQRDNENVECPICKCIYLKSSLAVHMRVHNGEKPYECQLCPKAFSTKWNLQLHKWTHANRSAKPFKCNQCNAAFYRHSDYTAHMNSHRNVRPYTCNYCGAQFIRKYNCLRHVKEHEETKAYTCDVCNKAFHRSYYLKEHLRVHSGQRPHVCHICGKSSSTKSNHNKHVRIHHAREPVNTEN